MKNSFFKLSSFVILFLGVYTAGESPVKPKYDECNMNIIQSFLTVNPYYVFKNYPINHLMSRYCPNMWNTCCTVDQFQKLLAKIQRKFQYKDQLEKQVENAFEFFGYMEIDHLLKVTDSDCAYNHHITESMIEGIRNANIKHMIKLHQKYMEEQEVFMNILMCNICDKR